MNVGMLFVAPFRGTVGNACCKGMDCLARWRHGRALNGNTGGQVAHGPFTATTKDGLVRAEKAGLHIGTVKERRWGWLAAAYEAIKLGCV